MSDESTTTSSERPTITLQDIISVVEILRVCTERGTWRVTELSTVGQLYERLVGFLEGAGVNLDGDPAAPPAEKE
jgi:hypothetical protein